MSDEAHVGDIGTEIRLTITEDSVAVNLSTTTTKQIKIKKPGGTLLTKTASFYTNGTDGKLKYLTIAGDLSEAGDYQVMGYVEFASGKWHTSKIIMSVYSVME